MEFAADYFDGASSRRHPVRVRVADRLTVEGEGLSLAHERSEARVLPRIGRTPARIALPGGGLLVAPDQDAVARALPVPGSGSLAHRLESHSLFVVLALAAVLSAAWLAYRDGIPWAAAAIAQRVPVEVEADLSRETLAALDGFVVRPSRLDDARRRRIERAFVELGAQAGLPGPARVVFRDGGYLGPNALALPGNVVLVTDQLAELMVDAEVAAVLAHELGHLRHRHGLRHVLVKSMHAFAAMAVFGDATGIAGVAGMFPTVFLTSAYSREFEREADAFAVDLLGKSGRSPEDFAEALGTLREAVHSKLHGAFGYLATHPELDERIRAARAAAR